MKIKARQQTSDAQIIGMLEKTVRGARAVIAEGRSVRLVARGIDQATAFRLYREAVIVLIAIGTHHGMSDAEWDALWHNAYKAERETRT